jgi:ParB/RepB/Spo0J family partition protein
MYTGHCQCWEEAMSYKVIPLSRIERQEGQPRTIFDEDKMAELVASITEFGVRTPVEVRPFGAGRNVRYVLVSGERRVRAARLAGLSEIPAIITRDLADDRAFELAIAENVNRDDMRPLEEAAAFARLVAEFGRTVEEVSTRFGKTPSYVQWRIDLLGLVPEAQELVNKAQLQIGIAWYVCRLSADQQHTFLKKWARGEFASFRDAEAYAQACREAADNPQGSFFTAEAESDEQREERSAARRKLTSDVDRLATAGKILSDIAAMDPAEVARLLGSTDGGVAGYRQRIGAIRKQASAAVSVLTKATALLATVTVELSADALPNTADPDGADTDVADLDAVGVVAAESDDALAGTDPVSVG